MSIHIDILTKGDKMYQGEFGGKSLGADGSLVSVTLARPRRFDRPAYLRAKDADPQARSDDFWKAIPTNMFLVVGSEISTMNLRYLPRDRRVRPSKREPADLTEMLKVIAEQVKQAQAAASPPRVTVEGEYLP